ncbi:MAG: hypothetical protein K0R17_1808 [Rariglobus sp.]|jgi:hypothetical protein|nr:hypothetical protein [Rariglobus sp.]
MKSITAILPALALLLAQAVAADTSVPIRHSVRFSAGPGDGTISYRPLDDEMPFFGRITEKQIDLWAHIQMPKPQNMSDADWGKMKEEAREKKKALIPSGEYELAKQTGEYVGWFGIARASSFDEKTGGTRLVVEHKYFDRLTDLRLQIVSIHGAGDFQAVLPGKVSAPEIPRLSLICVYGLVTRGPDGRTQLKTDYVRVWDWGLFSFMDYGLDKSSPERVKLRKVTGPLVYSPAVDTKFYEDRLGKR